MGIRFISVEGFSDFITPIALGTNSAPSYLTPAQTAIPQPF
jgi:hypothetical protein